MLNTRTTMSCEILINYMFLYTFVCDVSKPRGRDGER